MGPEALKEVTADMFVGKLIRVASQVVEGVTEGVLCGAQVLVKGSVKTLAETAQALADGVDQALTSVYAEIKGAVAETKESPAESKEEGK